MAVTSSGGNLKAMKRKRDGADDDTGREGTGGKIEEKAGDLSTGKSVASVLRECLVGEREGGEEHAELFLVKPEAAPVAIASERWQIHEAFTFPGIGFDLGDGGGQCDGGLFWEPTIHVFLASEKLSSSDSMLTAAAVEEEATSTSLSVSNKGGSFHSHIQFLSKRSGDSKIFRKHKRKLREAILEAVAAADRFEDQEEDEEDEGGSDDDNACDITSSWANVSREGGYHGLHNHEDASWSGVYYPSVPPQATSRQDPLAGAIVFRLSMRTHAGGKQSCSFSYIRPRSGMLLVFPSWLLHCVMPTASSASIEIPRVSIAFNTDEITDE